MGETGILGEGCIVAVGVLVEGNNEVIDVFGLWGDLAEDNAGTGKAGAGMYISYQAVSVGE